MAALMAVAPSGPSREEVGAARERKGALKEASAEVSKEPEDEEGVASPSSSSRGEKAVKTMARMMPMISAMRMTRRSMIPRRRKSRTAAKM